MGRIRSLIATWALSAGSIAALELSPLEAGSTAQLTALGNEALMQGRYETAIEHYRKALTADKTYFQAAFNLALAYQQLDRLDEARRWYEEAGKLANDHPEVHCNLGVIAFRAGDHAKAAAHFQDAARLAAGRPSDAADFWFNAGTARERLQEWREAQRAYEEALALSDAHFGAHYNLGTLYLGALADQAGAQAKAAAHLARAVQIDPRRSEAWLNLALVRERTGDGDVAAAYAQAVAVAGAGAPLHRALWQRARWHDRKQPPDRIAMRDDLLRILADDQRFPGANGMLGGYYFAVADFDAALTQLEREVADAAPGAVPDSVDLEAHYLLALIYTDHRSDPAKALVHATAYYQARPDSAKIHELRRRALRLSGERRP